MANYPEHVKRAEKLSAELGAIASENDRIARQVRNSYHNTGLEAPQFKKGDLVLEKNETRKDSLDRKFHGPYEVVDLRGTSVKIQKGRKRKWIHASRCKRFLENSNTMDITELNSDSPVTSKLPPEKASPVIEPVVVTTHKITEDEVSDSEGKTSASPEEGKEGSSPSRESHGRQTPV